METATVLSLVLGIAKMLADMLLAKQSPEAIARKMAAEATAFYAAQESADRKAKVKFPNYRS